MQAVFTRLSGEARTIQHLLQHPLGVPNCLLDCRACSDPPTARQPAACRALRGPSPARGALAERASASGPVCRFIILCPEACTLRQIDEMSLQPLVQSVQARAHRAQLYLYQMLQGIAYCHSHRCARRKLRFVGRTWLPAL